jgi:hypothetical protein
MLSPMDVCSRNLGQKAEKGKFAGSEATTRFPRASCFEIPARSVPETWGCMYDVLARSANGTRGTICVKLALLNFFIIYNNNFGSATNLCLCYAPAKCGR